MTKARNLNEPHEWRRWIRACHTDEWASKRLDCPSSLAMLTGQDCRALGAIAHCWALYAQSDAAGAAAALGSVRLLLRALQPKCHAFARDLIAQSLDWDTRARLWEQVTAGCRYCGSEGWQDCKCPLPADG